MIALCCSIFIVILDATIINVALPVIAKHLHGNINDLQWVVAGYALTFAGLLLTAGSVGDHIGAKPTFMVGLILFMLTSLGCGLAQNFPFLILFRLLQGIGGAMLVPTSLALINALYEQPEARAKAIGIWGGIGGIAAASGPVFGAVLAGLFNWRAIFFINIPIGFIGIWLTLRYVPTLAPTNHSSKHLDLKGQLCSILCIAALAFGLIEVSRLGWHAPIVVGSFVVFLSLLMVFIWIERNVANPMLPLQFFKIKPFSTALLVGMILNMSFYGELFLLPLYFQNICNYSVLETGFVLLPMTGITAISSYISGKIASRLGPKLPMMLGLFIGAIGFISLLLIKSQGASYTLFILPFMAIGFGISFTMPAATIATVTALPKRHAGLASGALNMSRQIGSLLGVAIFGMLVNTLSFMVGMHITLMLAAVTFLCGGLMVAKTYMTSNL